MLILNSPREAQVWCDQQRGKGLNVGFVPTMGALHAGHLSLVRWASRENDVCCASIFVNPLQFNNPSDLASYPDSFDQDVSDFDNAQCDMVFNGTLAQFLNGCTGMADIKLLDTGPAGAGLEGAFRPGHLEGVVTIVDRLFRTTGSCNAYFGEKDFQQTLVVKHLARTLEKVGYDIDVIVCPTIRDQAGLALSSRNQRLSARQKTRASTLHTALLAARENWQPGGTSPASIEQALLQGIEHPDISIEYAAVRDPENWTTETPGSIQGSARALVAVYLGDVRLIDNMLLGNARNSFGGR